MLRLAREAVYSKKIATVDEVVAKINRVTDDGVNALVEEFLNPKKYTVAAVGPITENEVSNILDDFNS
jgi:predicted Zn-dependent peptidase